MKLFLTSMAMCTALAACSGKVLTSAETSGVTSREATLHACEAAGESVDAGHLKTYCACLADAGIADVCQDGGL